MKLPSPILPTQIGVSFEDGILTLTLPKDPAYRSKVNKFNVGDRIAGKEPKVIDVKPVD